MSSNVINRLSAAAAAVIALVALSACTNTMRIASHGKPSAIDPIWTTAYGARSHGYLVYDTLFAMDENFEPKPQMVNTWTVSEDGRAWMFTLRDSLKWHDGTDVTAEDCVASLQRWGKRDGMGQQLFKDVVSLTAVDEKTFTMTLREPYGLVLESLAKLSANVPFMMPKRIAETDPMQPIKDATGSGPFIFKQDEREESKAVYIRNPHYLPRNEAQSLAAGGKVVKVDRLEWLYFPNQRDAVQALLDGKIDYVESPSTKLVPILEDKQDVVVASTDPLGNIAFARFNHRQPPFNNAEVRRAVLMAMKQEDYMTAALGDHRYWRTCYSVFACGTTFANAAGSEIMAAGGDLDAASKALQAAGYDGTPVVLLNPTDTPVMSALTQVTADTLRKIGMNVEVQDMDWASLLQRRNDRGPVSEGGWSMFHTWWNAADVADPTSIAFSGDPETGWYGWVNDEQLEMLRTAFANAGNLEEKQEIAAKVQERLLAIGAFGVLGQFYEPVAFRANVTGITSPLQFYWGVSLGK
jgi:peptide/nickel transport system substrate-binding protein